jgi:hypothetical protein
VQSLDAGIALKRRIIEDLRPSTLSNLGLTAALDVLCGEFGRRSEVKVQTDIDEVSLAEDVQLKAYRVVQEALTNVAKYAKARHVTVCLHNDGDVARLSVSNDGTGIDTRGVPMRARPGQHALSRRIARRTARSDVAAGPRHDDRSAGAAGEQPAARERSRQRLAGETDSTSRRHVGGVRHDRERAPIAANRTPSYGCRIRCHGGDDEGVHMQKTNTRRLRPIAATCAALAVAA